MNINRSCFPQIHFLLQDKAPISDGLREYFSAFLFTKISEQIQIYNRLVLFSYRYSLSETQTGAIHQVSCPLSTLSNRYND